MSAPRCGCPLLALIDRDETLALLVTQALIELVERGRTTSTAFSIASTRERMAASRPVGVLASRRDRPAARCRRPSPTLPSARLTDPAGSHWAGPGRRSSGSRSPSVPWPVHCRSHRLRGPGPHRLRSQSKAGTLISRGRGKQRTSRKIGTATAVPAAIVCIGLSMACCFKAPNHPTSCRRCNRKPRI